MNLVPKVIKVQKVIQDYKGPEGKLVLPALAGKSDPWDLKVCPGNKASLVRKDQEANLVARGNAAVPAHAALAANVVHAVHAALVFALL